jgi:hypothetical protein
MNKQHILRITLLVSVLAFNPAVAQVLYGSGFEQSRQQQHSSLNKALAHSLEEKGLEAEAAEKIATSFMDRQDGSIDLMAHNLLQVCPQISQAQIVAYLNNEALHRRSVALYDYGQLQHLFVNVTGTMPDKKQKERLAQIAKINQKFVTA